MKGTKLTKDWSKFTPSEGYEKAMQDIRLHDGTEISMCWPNAGEFFCCSDNSIPNTPAEKVAFVRLTHNPKWNW